MRGDFRGCRYFVMFRPPSLLAPQIVPTAANTPAGQPGLLRPSRTRFVTSPRIGYANRPTTGNWRYGDLHPARLRPCRLLPSPIHAFTQGVWFPSLRMNRFTDGGRGRSNSVVHAASVGIVGINGALNCVLGQPAGLLTGGPGKGHL